MPSDAVHCMSRSPLVQCEAVRYHSAYSHNPFHMGIASFFKSRPKVLIVEDDTTLRHALADKFNGSGYKVLEAGDARDVLTLLGHEKPDALVLDLILPIQDGISLLDELRKNGYDMPVVILSNLLGSETLRADADRLGARFFNKSSTSLEQIVDAVKETLS